MFGITEKSQDLVHLLNLMKRELNMNRKSDYMGHFNLFPRVSFSISERTMVKKNT